MISTPDGDKQQRRIGGRTLGAAGDDAQRVGVVHELGLVELVVILVLDLALGALPDRHHAVEGLELGVALVLGLVVVAGVLRFGLLAGLFAVHRDGEMDVVAVFLDKAGQRVLVEVVAVTLGVGILLEHQDDLGADVVLVGLGQGIALDAFGLPLPGGVRALRAGNNGDFGRHHERRVEADTELADDVDVIALVFGLEIQRAGARDGAEVLFELLFGHADAVVADGQRAAVLVGLDVDVQIVLADAHGGIGQAHEIALVAGVRRVGDQLAQKDFAVGVDRIDHQVEQFFALGLKLTHCHAERPLFWVN